MDAFMQAVEPQAVRAMAAGAVAYWVTLTLPKAGLTPREAVTALRAALGLVNKRNGFAGLGGELIGWIRVGEMGNGLSPHAHMLVFVLPTTTCVPKRVKKAWESALKRTLKWQSRPPRLMNSVTRLEGESAVLNRLKYMAKGDPYLNYSDKQKTAWEIATHGWPNLQTSRNWSPRAARQAAQPADREDTSRILDVTNIAELLDSSHA